MKYIDKQTLEDSTRCLYSDIDYCILDLCKARESKDTKAEDKALFKMETLMVATLQHLSCVLDALQQKQSEVDLKKEIKNYLATKCADDDEPSVSEIASHFYELGRNARKI